MRTYVQASVEELERLIIFTQPCRAASPKQTSRWLPGRRHGNRPFGKHKRLLPFIQIDRAHREFSDEHIQNIAIISQLHKGRRGKFVQLVDSYFAAGEGHRFISDVRTYQDLGDEMRKHITTSGVQDHAAVARGLVLGIREARADVLKLSTQPGEPVPPDGKPRAYILDSLRHPAEVNLLRAVYGDAFVLIGVVCEERKRIDRMSHKYRDAGHDTVREFMKRDEAAAESYGQQVAKAFHLSDFFVDNTVDRTMPDGLSRER